MKQPLIVYYSLSGNTKFIAEKLQNATNGDLLGIKPVKELDSEKKSTYFWGGFQATMKKKPTLEPFEIDPLAYDFIILGSPVWNSRITPPIRSFITNYDLGGKTLALWMCQAGKSKKGIKRFKEELSDSMIIGEMVFTNPKEKSPKKSAERAAVWGKELVEKVHSE